MREQVQPSLDLAYTSLEQVPQQWDHKRQYHRFLPGGEHPLAHPTAVALDGAGAACQITGGATSHAARKVLPLHHPLWRVVHIALALLTLSQTIWHLVYALQLLLSRT
jgi:hypothetical protein